MTDYQPSDEQIDALAEDDYGVAAPLMGVETKFEDWEGRGLHRIAVAAMTGTPAFQAIIRAAQDQREREVALRIRDAVDVWEASGDDEALVNDVLDPWINSAAGR